VRWVVKADGHRVAKVTQGFAAKDVVNVRFAKGTGKHLVTVVQDGVVVKTITVRTGR
jgi:hypothetical protein